MILYWQENSRLDHIDPADTNLLEYTDVCQLCHASMAAGSTPMSKSFQLSAR